MKVLMVITSHDQLGNTGRKTGFWLEELAAPYYVFKDAGVEITLGFLRPCREDADDSGKAKGHTGRQRSRVVEMGRQVVIFSGTPAWGLSI